ncbi:DNA polymerase III subunit beta [Nonomuraea angiospora]
MKFTIMSGDLADAVGWVTHALPKRATSPVLLGILLQAGEVGEWEGVEFSALDYETSRKTSVELDSPIDPGRILLPGRLLAEVAKVLPKNELVDIAADDREAVIRCGKLKYGIPLMPVEDFPSLPTVPAAIGSVSTKMFADAVAQAASAAGKDDTLPQLTGVRFEIGDGLIDLAATDRYRMTWRTLQWEPALDAPADVKALIPAKTLADVARGLPANTSVEICLDDGLAAFVSGDRCTTIRLLDPQFPDFRAHFEKVKDANITAEFDADALAKVVKRVALMAERSTPVRLSFTQAGVLVEAGGGENGRGSEQADASVKGDDITIAFDPARLLPALATFTGTVQLRMTKPASPAVLQRDGDDTYKHLVMPIRLS